MNSYRIYCDYVKARNKAEKLDKIADNIKNLTENQISSELHTLSVAWQGEGMNIYIKKSEEVKYETEIVVKNLRKTAETIRNVAERNYKSEMKALEISRKRDY